MGNDAMTARVRWLEQVSFVAETGSGHAVVVDGAPAAGGRNLGMRPMELVLAGAAACTAFDVVHILKRGRQPVADCVVEAEAHRADADPKVFTRIHLVYRVAGRNLDPHQVERAVRLSKEKYCSATLMLARTAEITWEVVLTEGERIDPPAARAHAPARGPSRDAANEP
jgi:putative redox protein